VLLAIDIGNTNTVLGLFEGERIGKHWRTSTHKKETADELSLRILGLFSRDGVVKEKIKAVIISSVVPTLDFPYRQMVRKLFGQGPMVVDHSLDLGITIKTDYPKEVGADRLVNATAYYTLCEKAGIIVDFGTATTFCAISENGEYMGGVIAPGITTSAEALFSFASKLPRIEITTPPAVIGKNTIHSMQSGLVNGYASMVEGIITKMKKEMASSSTVLATGGLAPLIAGISDCIDTIEPNLTLKGLSIIYRRNQKNHPKANNQQSVA
jgi:type III pantothenate kinase